MTTASITKTFVVHGEEQAKIFLDALEWCMEHPFPLKETNAKVLDSPEEVAAFLKERDAMMKAREADAAI